MDSGRRLLRSIEANANKVAARDRETVRVGSFCALLDSSTEFLWLNYAVPIAPVRHSSEVANEIVELQRVFADHRRTLRFEFIEALWPRLPAILEEAGLLFQARHPLMACVPTDFRPTRAPDVQVHLLDGGDPADVLATYLLIQRRGFADNDPQGPTNAVVPATETARLRRKMQDGYLRCALGTWQGTPAGVGCTAPLEGVCELAGVATLHALRRRGVAATVSSVLVRDHFDRNGTLVWLSAADAVAQSVYKRIGFHVVANRLNFVDRPAE